MLSSCSVLHLEASLSFSFDRSCQVSVSICKGKGMHGENGIRRWIRSARFKAGEAIRSHTNHTHTRLRSLPNTHNPRRSDSDATNDQQSVRIHHSQHVPKQRKVAGNTGNAGLTDFPAFRYPGVQGPGSRQTSFWGLRPQDSGSQGARAPPPSSASVFKS